MTLVFHFLRAFAILFLCLYAGIYLAQLLHLTIPGSILGMLLLFTLLASNLLPAHWVKPGANLFIRYMVLLFVPLSVGLMDHFSLLLNNLGIIFASVIGGSAIVIVLLGLLLDRRLKKGEN